MKRVLVGLCVGVALMVLASPAGAVTRSLTVTTAADSSGSGTGSCATGGACTLRQAVNQANLDTGDTITVPAHGTPYALSHGVLSFTSSATLTGAGAASTLISGTNSTQIMAIGATATVTVQGVTLEHGNASGPYGGAAIVADGGSLELSDDTLKDNTTSHAGGAVEDNGALIVQNSSFTGNSAGSVGGGAIYLSGPATGAGSLSVTDSVFSGNSSAENGGAIKMQSNGAPVTATINDSTFTGNSAATSGGAIVDSSAGNPATLSVSDSTIASNQAGTEGGGLYIGNGPTADQITNDTVVGNHATGPTATGGDVGLGGGMSPVLTNTIVAAGTAHSGGDCDGAVTSGGHNLDDQNGCGFNAAGDLINTNPRLGPLADNGGPTQTMALLAGSPAIDAGTNTGCPATDQRGVVRPQGSACDIGAYESAPPSATTGTATGVGTTGATLNGTVANPDAVAATVTFEYGTTTSYGSTVVQSAPAFSGQTGFSAALSSLQPNTTYHYRVVVTNPDGTATGGDQTFTTTATTTTPPPPPSNQFSITGHHVSKSGTIKLKVVAPDAGAFKAKATFKARTGKHHKRKKFTYGTGRSTANGAGTVTVTIKLGRHARAELLKLGHATVSVTITFSPTGGTPGTKTIKLKIKVKHRHFS